MAVPPAKRIDGPRRQRGVAAIFAAISLVALLMTMAFAIDVGRLYSAQRHLQKLADLAAIDAARVASGCLVGPVGFQAAVTEATDSLRRNGAASDVSSRVIAGNRRRNGELFEFQPSTASGGRDSIQVELTSPSPVRLLPLFAGPEARRLQVRAAAQSAVLVQKRVARFVVPDDPEFLNRYFGQQLGGALSLSGAAWRGIAQSSVTTRDVLGDQSTPGSSSPGTQQTTTSAGLLNQLASALDALGDSVVATVVQAFADVADAGRGAVNVVPSEVLGLPPDAPAGAYDNAVADVGSVLGAVADAVAGPGPIRIPIDFDPPLGDSTGTVNRPGSSQPGTFTPGFDRSTTQDDDGILRGGGSIALDTRLRNPVTGEAIPFPLALVVQESRARVTDVECRRRGVERTTVSLVAQGGGASFAIGEAREQAGLGKFEVSPEPVQLIAAPIGRLLPSAAVSEAARSRVVSVSIQGGPYQIGDPRQQSMCFAGPPWPQPGQALQCDGSAATVGRVSSRQALESLPSAMGEVALQLGGLDGLSPQDLAQVQPALQSQLLDPIAQQVQELLRQLPDALVPLLQASGLDIGGTAVSVQVSESPPVIYAR